MANTPRCKGDKRVFPDFYDVGTVVGMYDQHGNLVQGRVDRKDEGGWIYVDWKNTGGTPFPSYLRSTHVIRIEERKTA